MTLAEFLSSFGEAGLVFSLMATGIYFLARAYVRVQKKYEEAVKEFQDYLVNNQNWQVETIANFTSLLHQIKELMDRNRR